MNKAWALLRSSLIYRRFVVAAAFIAIVVVVPVVFANSGNAVSNVSLCKTGDLSGSAWLQGAAGQQVGILTIVSKGRTPCRLPTRPSVVLVWHGGALAIRQLPMPDDQSPSVGAPVSVLMPHAKSAVSLLWHNYCDKGPPTAGPFSGSLLVSFSHLSSPLRIDMKFAEVARCDFPNQQSTLFVSRFRSP